MSTSWWVKMGHYERFLVSQDGALWALPLRQKEMLWVIPLETVWGVINATLLGWSDTLWMLAFMGVGWRYECQRLRLVWYCVLCQGRVSREEGCLQGVTPLRQWFHHQHAAENGCLRTSGKGEQNVLCDARRHDKGIKLRSVCVLEGMIRVWSFGQFGCLQSW